MDHSNFNLNLVVEEVSEEGVVGEVVDKVGVGGSPK
jgi:hypothetical protein